MTELNRKEHIERVVQEQYRQLLEDPFTAPVFAHLNLDEHLPRIYVFWCFLLDIEAADNLYKGSAFEPHTKLGLTAEHFTRWLEYLHKAITQEFTGATADKWIAKSNELGIMFQYKMGLMDDESFLIGRKK